MFIDLDPGKPTFGGVVLLAASPEMHLTLLLLCGSSGWSILKLKINVKFIVASVAVAAAASAVAVAAGDVAVAVAVAMY